jgi:DNA-binding MarR family transcriptional regulator
MADDLSFDLHALVARLDRSADRLLSSEYGISYRRFLALFMVRDLGATTQRALAERLDISEPSVSRMTGVLAEEGLLGVKPDPNGGNRRRLELTAEGERVVKQCGAFLAGRFTELLNSAGIPRAEYARHTRTLLEALDD